MKSAESDNQQAKLLDVYSDVQESHMLKYLRSDVRHSTYRLHVQVLFMYYVVCPKNIHTYIYTIFLCCLHGLKSEVM